MASSSSNSSSFHVPQTKYDVFISFRGEDTRNTFLSHLVNELRRNHIDVYVDDRLHRGDEISSALLQAIEESFISLVIFSKHYACSTWCLEELVKIIECMEQHQRILIPVFYNIHPSDVRRQKSTVEEAFNEHQEKFKENMMKVQSWRSVLEKAANLSGFHYPSRFQNEVELIKEIVKDILEKLSHILPDVSIGLVGIDENVECIESLLAIESSEVRILGIWGMGGIGKTTIAEVVFQKYSSQYKCCCFLENIREESQKHGLPYLFQKLISELLEGVNISLKGPTKARSTNIKRRLSKEKVFIVLDDVSALHQLEHLIGEPNCLGPGSRVIVTTRDKQILKNVHEVYFVQQLNFKNSLKLFCLNAFSRIYPKIGYEKLSEIVVGYANGIPLALKVLGSFLSSTSIEAWESALRKLRNYPNMEIYDVLKLSYDGLDDFERNIFLDIAFFFKGERKDDVIWFLNSCGFFADIGIDSLQRKALISISNYNTIQMHDLIEQMGWEIVRQESIKDPGRRSRLRNLEDVYYVLKNNKGTDLVEGIMLDLSQIKDLHLQADTFKKMPRLRFLKLFFDTYSDRRPSNLYIPTDFESFFDELRYLEWHRYPLKSLPSTFCAEKLVELHMPQSEVSKLWDGLQNLVNLKKINLHGCKKLVELPDFTTTSNLKEIYLSDCESLCHVHPSILSIHTLEYLRLSNCKELKSLTADVLDLVNLKAIFLDGCKKLVELPDFTTASNLREIYLSDCESLRYVHPSILSIHTLEYLCLSNCKELKSLTADDLVNLKAIFLDGCKKLVELPDFITASNLRKIDLSDCESLCHVHPSILSIHTLEYLRLSNCKELKSLTADVLDLVNLKEIFLDGCKKLVEIPDFTTASNLKEIYLSDCENLCHVHPSILSIHTLEYLHLSNCKELKSLTADIFDLVNLKVILLDGCKKLVELPDFTTASNLKQIDLSYCTEPKSLEGLIHLKSLQYLTVSGWSGLKELPFSSEEMRKLKQLNLKDLKLKSLPNELCLLTSLTELQISGCEQLIELPGNIKALSHLWFLDLSNCSGLRSLPELPPSIQRLVALNCTSLETLCTKAVYSFGFSCFLFENCTRLDKPSIYAFACIRMAGVMLRNFARTKEARAPLIVSPHILNNYRVCYPGSEVPEWFRYRRSGAFITVELDQPSQLLGFFFCCVISPPCPFDKGPHYVQAYCHLRDGQRERRANLFPQGQISVQGLKSDHVFMCDWCYCSGLTTITQEISFEFGASLRKVYDVSGTKRIEYDGVKGCGIYPIYVSGIKDFIQTMKLDFEIDC